MDERIVHCLTLNSLTLNVGSLNVATSRRPKEKPIGYFKFADPEVSRIVAENWGDGIGTTLEQIEAVTDIGTKFSNNTAITSFDELGKFTNLTTISNNAFNNDTSLKSINLKNVVKLGDSTGYNVGVFMNCTSLENIGDISNIERLNASSFKGCSNLVKELYFPNLKEMGFNNVFTGSGIVGIDAPICNFYEHHSGSSNGIFQNCVNLKYIKLPNFKRVFNQFAYGCTSLETVVVHPDITEVSTSSFEGCTILKSFDFSKIESVRRRAFAKCSSLLIKDISNVKIIDEAAFAKCKSLENDEINLPNLETLGGKAFHGIPNIKRIKDLGKITTIQGFSGEQGCDVMELIIMPETTTSLNHYAFGGNGNVRRTLNGPLVCKAITPPSIAGWHSFPNGNFQIYVPDQSVEAYKNASGWNDYTSKIKPINVADTLPDISIVAENDLYKIGEVYWRAELVDSVLTWVKI